MIGETPLQPLIDQLSKLPGIGPKSAQRLAFFILRLSKKEVADFASALTETRDKIRYCEKCYNISLTPVCSICSNPQRDPDRLCIVAEPRDVFAIERTHTYKGLYHVLGGLISPIDDIHPESLRLKELIQKVMEHRYGEIICAINPTIEGDATILYISQLLDRFNIPLSKLAYGLPIGADIDYTDELTLQKALSGRVAISRES
jgi:recombination protein RecR